jgi:hypothetical protein
VIEHVQDDRAAICEMIRVLKLPGGHRHLLLIAAILLKRTEYFGGQILFWEQTVRELFTAACAINLSHVRVYSSMQKLFDGLNVKFIERTIIFGAYDNIIARFGVFGKFLRAFLQFLESTPLKGLGLSHFWVVEKM